MSHVVFYEPPYVDRKGVWEIRGSNRYKSLLGNLSEKTKVTILMSQLPPKADADRISLEEEFGVQFEQLNSHELMNPAFANKLVDDLAHALRKLKPTVLSNLNSRNIGFCYAAALAARRLQIGYVCRLGGNHLEAQGEISESRMIPYWGTESYYKRLVQERIAAELASRIIVMSRREHIRLASLTADAQKVHICIRGVDQKHFRAASRRKPRRCTRFLFVGRRSPEKGFDILEQAMQRLAGENPELTATFAGSFDVGQKGNRRYVGFVEYNDLPALYNSHDALVICSRSEGFPQVAMEAMSCGIPCILTRELFEFDFSDGNGCLFTELTAADLAEKMKLMSKDDELYAKLVSQSKKISRELFSDTKNRNNYHDILLFEK